MADSPAKNKDRVLACSVYVNGSKLKDTFSLVSASVRLALNRIGKATLKFNAGNMDAQTFDESDNALFKPGNPIRLDAGDTDKQETLFEGSIIGVRILTGKDFRSYMVVECRDCAYPATQGRKNRIFEKKKDSDIIKEVLGGYGSVDVDATQYQHPALVQYYCSDWDFTLSRADACGLFVFADGTKIKVKKPEVSGSPVLAVTFGEDLTAFDLELTADDQFTQYEAVSWSPKEQKAVKVSASSPSLNKQGDLQPKSLAAGDSLLLQTDAPTEEKALKQWADGMALKAGLARYQGSVSFYGSAKVKPGCLIELKGLGKRFNGNLFVGSVTHTIEDNEWLTEAGAGVSPMNITDEPDVVSPSASGFLPGLQGLHAAVVKKLDGDPLKEYRIQVELPWPGRQKQAALGTPRHDVCHKRDEHLLPARTRRRGTGGLHEPGPHASRRPRLALRREAQAALRVRSEEQHEGDSDPREAAHRVRRGKEGYHRLHAGQEHIRNQRRRQKHPSDRPA